MSLSPEREAEIRAHLDANRYINGQTVGELLAEIDRLRDLILPPDTVCACLEDTGERKVRVYERCERCGAFMESDLWERADRLERALREMMMLAEPGAGEGERILAVGRAALDEGRDE